MNKKIDTTIFDSFPNLESERLIYREFKLTDAPHLFAMRSDDKVMSYMDTNKHLSIHDSEKYIIDVQKSFKEKTGINWVLAEKSSNSFIGYVGLWKIMYEHIRAEIGYALKPEFWGKGFMNEAIARSIDFGFNTLKVHSIEGNCNPKNESSIRVLTKLGFKKEAYFRENYFFNGDFTDSIIFSLLESDVK